MKGWRLAVAIIVGVALIAVAQIWARTRHPAIDPTRDYSCLRTNKWGTKALREMCRTLGYRVRVWHRPLDELPDDAAVVLMIAPRDAFVAGEFEALRKWVRAGGTLIVAPLPDRPEAPIEGGVSLTAGHFIAAWLGCVAVVDVALDVGELAVAKAPRLAYHVERLMLKWTTALEYVETRSAVKRALRAEAADEAALDNLPPAELLKPTSELIAGGRTVVFSFTVGDGHVVILSEPDVFANRSIGRADNALLAAALILPNAADGTIVFDEYHHGAARWGDRRGRASGRALSSIILLFLGTLTAYLLLGATRMGRAHVLKPRPRRSVLEYVQAVAWLYQRAGMRSAALVFLERSLRRAAVLRLGVPLDAPPARFGEAARQRGLAWADRLHTVLEQCEAARENPEWLTRQRFVALARQIAKLHEEITRHGQ